MRTGLLTPKRQLKKFVAQKNEWIVKILEKQAVQQSEQPQLIQGGQIYYLGTPHILRLEKGSSREAIIDEPSSTITFHSRSENMEKLVSEWLKIEAEKHLVPLTKSLAGQLGVKELLKEIRFRKTRSKWGHCSRAGVIQYNWQIMQAPEQIIHYLASHEASHLVQMNHSRQFWETVASLDPDYKRHRKWLRDNQHRLYF